MRLHGLVLTIALAATACVTSPYHGDYIDPHDEVIFAGWATQPDRLIRIQGQRKNTGQWVTLATGHSEHTGYTAGGETGYPYEIHIVLSGLTAWQCLFSSSCSAGYGILNANFRVLEEGGPQNPLVTLTRSEMECIHDALQDGLKPTLAYDACGTGRTFLRVYWDNRTRPTVVVK